MKTRSIQNTNLTYEILDTSCNNINPEINSLLNNDDFFSDFHEDFENVDQDNIFAQQLEHFDNFNVKILQHFACYYKLPKYRIKKDLLIQKIIDFENNPENAEIVYKRKNMWNCLNELQNDDYFSKFILFTS